MQLSAKNFSLHTHCTYCDGKNTIEEMVNSAIEQGIKVLGLSSHSFTIKGDAGTMKLEDFDSYCSEVSRCKETYSDKIEILLGLEWDVLSKNTDQLKNLDYFIGSVHNIYDFDRGLRFSIDESVEELQRGINTCFNGDAYKFLEAYFNDVREVSKLNPDIIGHFDLPKKLNADGAIFNENDARYIEMACDTLNILAKSNPLLELNTSCFYKDYRRDIYPSDFILKHWASIGGSVCITADSHTALTLLASYDKALQLCASCGIEELYGIDSKRNRIRLCCD